MAKAATKGNKKTMTDNTTPATGGKQSLEQRIIATRALLAKYEARLNAEKQINNVQVGDEGVTFKFGRSDKAREETGKVVAVADSSQGKVVSVLVGEGVDMAIRKVRAADIISNPSADERNAAEGGEEAATDADPLAAE